MTDWNRHFAMVKQKGDRKVQTWNHPRSGLSAEIYLRGTRFVALFLEQTFEAPDVAMLRKKLSDKAEHWIEMEWHPVIEIEIDEDRHGGYRDELPKEGIGFGYKRFYLSQSPVGEILAVDWDVDPEHRKAQMDSWGGGYRNENYSSKIRLTGLPLRAPLKKSSNEWLMDYDESLWRGFQEISKGIRQLSKRLREIVSTKQGLQLLMNSDGTKLLTQ